FYKQDKEYRASDVDVDRVWHNACALVATTRAVVIAVRAQREKVALEKELVARWLEALSHLHPNQSQPEMSFRWNWPQDAVRSPIQLLECAYSRLPSGDYPLRAALEWSRWRWEQVEKPLDTVRRACGSRVPLAGVLTKGFIADLELHALPNSPAELIDDP